MSENSPEKFEKDKKSKKPEKKEKRKKASENVGESLKESKKKKEIQDEVARSLVEADQTVDIPETSVEKAQIECVNAVEIDTVEELNTHSPDLVDLIEAVSDYFQVPSALLYATLFAESRFQHGVVGDPNKPGKSIGIGQFREETWNTITSKKEYFKFMNSVYPGEQFDRGENILADIAATAVFLKDLAKQGKIDPTKDLEAGEVIYIRARYRGSTNAKMLKKLFGDYNNDLKNPENEDYMYKFFERKMAKECAAEKGAACDEAENKKYFKPYKDYLDFYYKYLSFSS
jgi:hypothetical protein